MKDGKSKDWLMSPMFLHILSSEQPVKVASHAKKVLGTSQALGADTLCHTIQVGGTFIHNSALAERTGGLDGDLLNEFVTQSHNQGMRFIAAWLGTAPGCAVEIREHPDWIKRIPDGSPIQGVCYNSPYREFLLAHIREVLENYLVDGIFFDQFPVGCFCVYCKQAYEEKYGEKFPELTNTQCYPSGDSLYPIPGDSEKFGVNRSVLRKLYDFSCEKRYSMVWNIRKVLNEVRPETCLILNRVESINAQPLSGMVDAFLPEGGLPWQFHGLPPEEGGGHGELSVRIFQSLERYVTGLYAKKPIIEVLKYDKLGVRGYSSDHAKVLMTEAVSYAHVPMHRTQDYLDYTTIEERAKVYKTAEHANKLSAIINSEPAYSLVAILHSKNSFHFSCDLTNRSFFGMARFCMECHLPFTGVTEQDIQDGNIPAQLLLLPNCVCLEKATLSAIESFVEQGGNLLVMARAGECDEDIRPHSEDILAKLCGLERIGWHSNRDQGCKTYLLKEIPIPALHGASFKFVRVDDNKHLITESRRGSLIDFNGGNVQIENIDGTTLASVCAFDQSLINASHFVRRIPYPGEKRYPFLVVSEKKSRRAYLGAPVGDESVRVHCEGLQQIMKKAILWCAGEPDVVAVELPPTIKMTVRGSIKNGRMIVLLTTQYLADTVAVGCHFARLSLNCPSVAIKSCRSLISEVAIELKDNDRHTEFTVERVQPYEAVEITFNNNRQKNN